MTLTADSEEKDSGHNTRIAVTRSVTTKENENYSKTIASIESDLPQGLDALEGLEQINGTLSAFFLREAAKPVEEQKPKPAEQPKPKPAIDPAELEKLPWAAMSRNPKGFWIYSDTSEAQPLVAELAKADKKTLTIGSYVYRLSGEGDRFVNRWPHKGESAN